MAKRGRPRHPDILTPREWEVLALVREGLSNEQIAERLGITERTARFHVSEILSKLGVSTRQEAAAWQPEERPRRWWAIAIAPLAFGRRLAWGVLAATGFGVIIVAAGLLAWAALRTHGDQPATTNAQAEAAPTPIDVTSRPASQYILVYVRPVNGPMADGHVRTIDAQTGHVDADADLGTMFSGNLVISDTPPATRLVTFGPLAGQALIRDLPVPPAGPNATSSGLLSPRSYQGAAAIGDVLYQPEGNAIVGRDGANQIVASYAIPQPLPPRGDEPIFTTPTKGMFDRNSKGSPSVIVADPSGHLLAFVEGLTNSVVVDLGTGARLDLAGYDRVFAATLAKDGYVYALVHNAWFPLAGYEVMKIDPVALHIVARHPMDFNWRTHLPNGFFALASPDGGVYMYLPAVNLAGCPGTPDGSTLDQCPNPSLLYHVDTNSAATTLVPLPPALGIDASAGVDGKIYFYGGVGENRVSRYDPVTGQVETDVPSLRAPEGTYIQAVLPR